jgi:FhaA, N-terminal domain/FHA domain
MGILRDFEHRLEGAVEGLFSRVFRSGVQPVELGKRLRREMRDSKSIGVQRLYVPNVYAFELSAEDRSRFADYEAALANELATVAVRYARENDWAMLGRARVEFDTGENLIQGRFRVRSRVEADEAGQAAHADQQRAQRPATPTPYTAGPATAMLPGELRQARPHAPAVLVLLSGARSGQGFFPLDGPEAMIGRAENAHVSLPDPGISRLHARIVREGDDFVVEDLGSTNGTEVNGQLIKRRRLADGDRVRLGNSTLQFRRER